MNLFRKLFKMLLVGSCCYLATKQNSCKCWWVAKVHLFIELKKESRIVNFLGFYFFLFGGDCLSYLSGTRKRATHMYASFDFVRGFRKFKILPELSFEFFHNSRLIRWIQKKRKIHRLNQELNPHRLLSTTLNTTLDCFPCLCETVIESHSRIGDFVPFI